MMGLLCNAGAYFFSVRLNVKAQKSTFQVYICKSHKQKLLATIKISCFGSAKIKCNKTHLKF